MSLATLRSRVPAVSVGAPQRPIFHHLLTVSEGRLRQVVDFTEYAVRPGMWLWVRPGQVQQWGDLTHAEGTLVLFEQDFLDPATVVAAQVDDPHAPSVCSPLAGDADALRAAVDHLGREFHAFGQLPLDLHTAALRHLLAVLVLRLRHVIASAQRDPAGPGEIFLRFRAAVERDFLRTRRVEDYAASIGYSARTLSRATRAAAGVGAKELIDRRVILEAKRLLAHGDFSSARIAARLGFSSATNFSKYFHLRTGHTPLAFRSVIRGQTPPGE